MEREREREKEKERQRERERKCVCAREREIISFLLAQQDAYAHFRQPKLVRRAQVAHTSLTLLSANEYESPASLSKPV
jgi:hypothetical protein